jgi:hypothetical protein
MGEIKILYKILGYEDVDWICWSQQGPEMVPYEQGYELLGFIKCWVY